MSDKRYTQEFKDETVRFLTEQGHPAREVAAGLGISEHTMYRWIRAAKPPAEEQQEIKRLNRELKRTREERDILKKATAYFIKDPD